MRRSTARAALDKLESEGCVTRRSGKGSIVSTPRVDQSLNLLASFAGDMRARGLTPSYLMWSVEIAVATEEVAKRAGTRDRHPYGHDRPPAAGQRRRHRSQPILALCHRGVSNLPTHAELDTGSLYRWMKKRSGHHISGGSEFIEAVNANEQIELARP